MTHKQFFMRVAALRQLQKAYFKSRSSETLRQAKAVEREVDDEIARVKRAISHNQSASDLPAGNCDSPMQSDTSCSGESGPSRAALILVKAVLQNKRDQNIVPGYAIAHEVHALLNDTLDTMVSNGRLVRCEASVNRLAAYDLPVSTPPVL